MGFDINGFRNAFFAELKRASNIETTNNKIDTDKEVQAAKGIQSAFAADLAKVSEPIGDAFVKTDKSENKGEFNDVSFSELTALLDDSELNIARVNQLIEEKPVETLSSITKVSDVKQSTEVKEMAEISDGDTDAINFYADKAVVDGRDSEIAKNTEASEEGIDELGPKFFDAFMEYLYAA